MAAPPAVVLDRKQKFPCVRTALLTAHELQIDVLPLRQGLHSQCIDQGPLDEVPRPGHRGGPSEEGDEARYRETDVGIGSWIPLAPVAETH